MAVSRPRRHLQFDHREADLDHILVSTGVKDVVDQVVHVNAEYHDQVSDHAPRMTRPARVGRPRDGTHGR